MLSPHASVRRLLPLLLCLPALAEEGEALKRDLVRARAELARQCEDDGLVEEAVREWRQVRGEDAGNADAAAALSRLERPWVLFWDEALHRKYLAYVDRRVPTLEALARRRLALGDARGAVALAPDLAEARERLGEVRVDGVWMPKEDAARRAEGFLPIGGRWLPAAEVTKRRSVWAEAWEARGAHFLVKSNRSEAAAREVLELAESVYAAVHRELCGEVDPPALKKLLSVYDFASRDDFLAHLDAAHDGGSTHRASPGFFSSLDGASHFAPIAGGTGFTPGDVARHEIAHQVCDALWPPQGMLAEHPHFWAWEGVAGYFESIEVRDGKILTGDPGHPRLDVARRALEDGRTLPLEEFVQLDGEKLKGRYNQAASLAHFFLRAGDGKQREAFLRYFRVVAGGKAEATTFEKAFGRKPGEFQGDWEDFVRGGK